MSNIEYWTRFCGDITIVPKIEESLCVQINSRFKDVKIYPKRSVMAYFGNHKHCNHFEETVKEVVDDYLLTNGYVCNGLIFAVGDGCYENHWAVKVVNNRVYRKDFIYRRNEPEKVKISFPSFLPICIDDSYEVKNGLIGMTRDVVLRLIGMCNDEKIRTVLGVSSSSLIWKSHFGFIMMRKRDFRLMLNENEGFNVHGHSNIEAWTHQKRKNREKEGEEERKEMFVTPASSIIIQFDKTAKTQKEDEMSNLFSSHNKTEWRDGNTVFLDKKLTSGDRKSVV